MAITTQYYICNRCHFRTTLLSRINDHLLIHTYTKQPLSCFETLKSLKCNSCDFTTEFLILLRYHLFHTHDQQKFHLKAKLKTCKKCRFYTHSNYLWIRHGFYGPCKGKKVNRNQRDGKWYLCKKCDYRTVNLWTLKNHVINNHTPLEEINWQQCKKCPARFKTLHSLKQHLKLHASVVKYLHCSECEYSTPSRYNLKTHFNSKHTRLEDIQWAECCVCGAKFKDQRGLRKHSIKHKGKEFNCEQCPFKTHRKDSLKRHFINRHLKKEEDMKLYNCQHSNYKAKNKHIQCNDDLKLSTEYKECDYKICSTAYLTKNMTNITLTTKQEEPKVKVPITGEKCSFVTTTKELLQSHIFNKHREHTEEEKMNCLHCNYFCFNKRYLNQHLKLKHEIGGNIKCYKCDKCDYKSQYKNSLISHMHKVHNDGKLLECDQCIYKTGSPYSMQWHKKNHKMKKLIPKTVSEKFECYICGYTTNKKGYIYTHITKNHLKGQLQAQQPIKTVL